MLVQSSPLCLTSGVPLVCAGVSLPDAGRGPSLYPLLSVALLHLPAPPSAHLMWFFWEVSLLFCEMHSK